METPSVPPPPWEIWTRPSLYTPPGVAGPWKRPCFSEPNECKCPDYNFYYLSYQPAETTEEFKEWKRFGQVHHFWIFHYTEHLIDGLDLRKISNDKICIKSFKIFLICFWASSPYLINTYLQIVINDQRRHFIHIPTFIFIGTLRIFAQIVQQKLLLETHLNFTMVNCKPTFIFIGTPRIFAQIVQQKLLLEMHLNFTIVNFKTFR